MKPVSALAAGLCLLALTACQLSDSDEAGPRANPSPPTLSRVDRIVVEKAAHRMAVYRANQPPHIYQVSLGVQPVGPKLRQGDHRTPEGTYQIIAKNADSRFHRSLRISYPSPEDQRRAASRGEDPGGDIMIHGLPNGKGWIGEMHRTKDWTNGCIAVTDQEIEEIWRLVPVGTPIEIKP